MALLLFAGCSLSVCAQQRKVQNKPFIDERRFHYGFTVGLHDQGLSLTNNGFIDPATGAQWVAANDRHNFGFSVGVLGEWKQMCIRDRAIGSKIADYLLKPVNPKQILLTLKKNIHRTEIQQEVVQTNYRQEFARISMQIGDDLNAEQWKELYKKLVHWELELDEADESMREMLGMQKTEANLAFAKFIKKNYENWIANPDERPLISPDLFKKVAFPKLSAGRKVFLLSLIHI